MSNYAYRRRPPTTLTELEQKQVLRVTGTRRSGFRDHVIISLALGTGLRAHELVALDVKDVVRIGGDEGPRHPIRRRITLRRFKGCETPGRKVEQVILPNECRRKLELWVDWLWVDDELDMTAPLFRSREGGRLSLRQLRTLWHRAQQLAGLERRHPFHALRHTFVSNVYSRTKCIVTAQLLARHRGVETTMIYAHVGDETLDRAVRDLPS